MFKKITLVAFLILSLIAFARPVTAQNNQITLYFFWSKTCPHCAKEKEFLAQLVQKYPRLQVRDFEISTSRENLALFKKIGQQLNLDIAGVPFTAVGKYHFSGFLSAATTGQEIEAAVQCALANGCQDLVGPVIEAQTPVAKPSQKAMPETIELPLIGQVKTKSLSLPALTLMIALLDGFNPCAMWILLFLISLLLGMQDRRRMWLLGTTFIVTSGLAYFLFMAAWLNLFLFLGFVFWIRVLVGLLALFAAGYNLRDWWVNRSGGCETVGESKREKMFAKMKRITQERSLWLALGGLIILAFGINLIELVCSAGLPAIYTSILSLTNLPGWQYYLYLLFYVFIFMLDDLLVFFVAMATLQAVGIQSKYARWSRLIGGLLMLVIGILMLVKPEWLMFG